MTRLRPSDLLRPVPGGAREGVNAPAVELWRLFEAGAWAEAQALLHPEFVAYWPQSGERFRGPENFIAVNRAHPAPGWTLTVTHVVDTPALSAVQLTLEHLEGVDHGSCFYGISGGLIAEASEIWAEGTPAPAWRAAWAELPSLNYR